MLTAVPDLNQQKRDGGEKPAFSPLGYVHIFCGFHDGAVVVIYRPALELGDFGSGQCPPLRA